MDAPRAYESPPRRPESWTADRPGELAGGQPAGDAARQPGPDQGYALKLAAPVRRQAAPRPTARPRRRLAGCVGVALKRASLFGRAPVVHDLTVAFTVWGFLDERRRRSWSTLRRPLFAEVAPPDHYVEQRAIVDARARVDAAPDPAGGRRRTAATGGRLLDSGLTGSRSNWRPVSMARVTEVERPQGHAAGSRRRRPATCTSAAPARPCSTGCSPATPAASSCCASRTPTPSATGPS